MSARLAGRLGRRVRRGARLALKGLVQRARPRGDAAPLLLLVAGVQRSGTNMVMDVLERSLETEVFHERDPRAFDNYEMRPLGVIAGLRERSRARVVVVKALCELDHLTFLMDRLAPARAVWVVREWRDSVRSQLRSFPRHPGWIRRTLEDPAEGGWIGRGLVGGGLLERARRLAPRDMDDVTAAALFWWFRNMLLFEQGLDRDPRVQVLRYEDLVREPERAFAALFRHAGLRFEPSWASDVSPRSVGRGAGLEAAPAVARACDALLERIGALAGAATAEGEAAA